TTAHVLFIYRSLSTIFLFLFFFFYCYRDHRDLHSFPTRRSSDLNERTAFESYFMNSAERQEQFRIANALKIYIGGDTKLDPSIRSEEHTSELQSRRDLVCRLLLEKKKKKNIKTKTTYNKKNKQSM